MTRTVPQRGARGRFISARETNVTNVAFQTHIPPQNPPGAFPNTPVTRTTPVSRIPRLVRTRDISNSERTSTRTSLHTPSVAPPRYRTNNSNTNSIEDMYGGYQPPDVGPGRSSHGSDPSQTPSSGGGGGNGGGPPNDDDEEPSDEEPSDEEDASWHLSQEPTPENDYDPEAPDPDDDPDDDGYSHHSSNRSSRRTQRNPINEFTEALQQALRPPRNNKPRPPDTFNGSDSAKLDPFILQCVLYFRGERRSFTEDEDKVNFALSYLRDSALDWFEPAITADLEEPWMFDWQLFAQELHDNFGLVDPVANAETKITELKMTHNQKITDYIVKFKF